MGTLNVNMFKFMLFSVLVLNCATIDLNLLKLYKIEKQMFNDFLLSSRYNGSKIITALLKGRENGTEPILKNDPFFSFNLTQNMTLDKRHKAIEENLITMSENLQRLNITGLAYEYTMFEVKFISVYENSNSTSLLAKEDLIIQTPDFHYRDDVGTNTTRELADYICINNTENMGRHLSQIYSQRNLTENATFCVGYERSHNVLTDFPIWVDEVYYLVPRNESKYWEMTLSGDWKKYMDYYVVDAFEKKFEFVKNVTLDFLNYLEHALTDNFNAIRNFLYWFRSPRVVRQAQRFLWYIMFLVTLIEIKFGCIPSALVQLTYVYFMCVIDLFLWFDLKKDLVSFPIMTMSAFFCFTVLGFFLSIYQMFSLFKRSNDTLSFCKSKFSTMMYWCMFTVYTMFKFCVSFLFNHFSYKLISMNNINLSEEYLFQLFTDYKFLFDVCVITVLILVATVGYALMAEVITRCRRNRWFVFREEIHGCYKLLFNILFPFNLSWRTFKNYSLSIFFFVSLVTLLYFQFQIVKIFSFVEGIVWFFFSVTRLLETWVTFCIGQILVTGLFHFLSSGVIFEKVDSAVERLYFSLRYLCILFFVYTIDVLKRIIIYVMVVPFCLYLSINYQLSLGLSFISVVILSFVNLYLFMFLLSGLAQYSFLRHVLVNKCWCVKVYISGLDNKIRAIFQESLASQYPKMLQDVATLLYNRQTDNEKLVRNQEMEMTRILNDINMFNKRMRSENAKFDKGEHLKLLQTIITIVTNQVLEKVKSRWRVQGNTATANTTLTTAAAANIEDQEAFRELAREIREILNLVLVDDELDFANVERRFRAYYDRFFPLPELPNEDIVPVHYEPFPIDVLYRNPDWGLLMNNFGFGAEPLRTIYAPRIWALTEEEAAEKFSGMHPEIPEDCRWRGVFESNPKNKIKGLWEIRSVSTAEQWSLKDTAGYANFEYYCQVFFGYLLTQLFSLFLIYKDIFLFKNSVMSTAMVDLLYESRFFPEICKDDLHEMVFNQNKFNEITIGQDLEKVELVKELINHSPHNKKEEKSIKQVFETYLKNKQQQLITKKKTDPKFEKTFEFDAIRLEELLNNCNISKIPSYFPNGLVVVAHLGFPYIIKRNMLKKYNYICAEMIRFDNREVCLGFGFNKNFYNLCHLRSVACKQNMCGSPITATAGYGFVTQGNTTVGICTDMRDMELRPVESIGSPGTLRPTSLPYQSLYGVKPGDSVIGNAICVDCNGKKRILTAAHVIAQRGDLKNYGPREWSETPVYEVSDDAIRLVKKLYKTDEYAIINNFVYPKKVNLVNIIGQNIMCEVDEIDGEIAFLKPIDILNLTSVGLASGEIDFEPDFVFAMDGPETFVVPIASVTKSGKLVLDYKAKAGYSGAALYGNGKVYGLHLGGNNAGVGIAYARIFPKMSGVGYEVDFVTACSICNGYHSYMSECEVVSHFANIEIEEEDTYVVDRSKKREKVYLSESNGYILARVIDTLTGQQMMKTYSINEFIEQGLKEIYNPAKSQEIIVDGHLNEYIDDLFAGQDVITQEQLSQKINLLKDSIVQNQIKPVDEKVYKQISQEIGENELIELLGKSMIELQDLNSNIIDTNTELIERKKQLMAIKNELESSHDYVLAMQDYRKKLTEFMQKKKNAEMFQKEFAEQRAHIIELRKKITEEFERKFKTLNNMKNKLVTDLQIKMEKFKQQGQRIVQQINKIEEEKKQKMKKGLNLEQEKVLRQIEKIDKDLIDLKRQRKDLMERKSGWTTDSDAFLEATKLKLENLKQELSKIKDQRRSEQERVNSEIKRINEEKSKLIAEKKEKLPEIPKKENDTMEKPKMPKIDEVLEIDEAIRHINKSMKMNSSIQRAVAKLIKCEKETQKAVDLSKLMEVSKETATEQIMNQAKTLAGFIKDIAENIECEKEAVSGNVYSMARISCIWLLFKGVGIIDKLLQEYCEECKPEFQRLFDELWLQLLERLNLENLTDEELYSLISSMHGFDQISNHSIKSVVVNLTASTASSRTFRANCINPLQPASVSCSRCGERFVCNIDHAMAPQFEGTIGRFGCVLMCTDRLLMDRQTHFQKCNATNPGNFSFTNTGQGAALVCMHSSQNKNVNICPAHLNSGMENCLSIRENRNFVKIIVDCQERWIAPSCLMGFIYRMVKCNGDCNRSLSAKELTEIENMYDVKGRPKNKCTIGQHIFCFDNLTPKEIAKAKYLLGEWNLYEFNTVTDQEDMFNQLAAQLRMEFDQKINELKTSVSGFSTPESSDDEDDFEVAEVSASGVSLANQLAVNKAISELPAEEIEDMLIEAGVVQQLENRNDVAKKFSEALVRKLASKLNLDANALKHVKPDEVQEEVMSWEDTKDFMKSHIVSAIVLAKPEYNMDVRVKNILPEILRANGTFNIQAVENHASLSDVIKETVSKQIAKIGKKTFKQKRPRRNPDKSGVGRSKNFLVQK